jgi:hypothetical protein
MRPPLGAIKPAIILSSVVFPQPDGPRMEKNCPCSTAKETSFNGGEIAEFFSYRFDGQVYGHINRISFIRESSLNVSRGKTSSYPAGSMSPETVAAAYGKR